MRLLTPQEKLARNTLAETIRKKRPGMDYPDALRQANQAMRAVIRPAGGQPAAVAEVQRQVDRAVRKAVRRRLRETAAGTGKPGKGGKAASRAVGSTAPPAKTPQQMSPGELEASLGALASGTRSPFWRDVATESAPQGPAAAGAPAAGGKPLRELGHEDFTEYAGAFIGATAAAAGSRSPFLKGLADG